MPRIKKYYYHTQQQEAWRIASKRYRWRKKHNLPKLKGLPKEQRQIIQQTLDAMCEVKPPWKLSTPPETPYPYRPVTGSLEKECGNQGQSAQPPTIPVTSVLLGGVKNGVTVNDLITYAQTMLTQYSGSKNTGSKE